MYGKTIELFLVNGTADSLVTAELSNWNGKAIKIPRIEVTGCKRQDLRQIGIYFLFCKKDEGPDAVYIGEAENIQERLVKHIQDYQSEREKYYWSTAVCFTGRDLNKALIRYLENRFVEIARACKRFTVLTKNTYKKTVMKESQIAVMEEFIDNVKILINALGYKVLEPMVKNYELGKNDPSMLYLNVGNTNAKGMVTTEGFVLFADSTVNEKTSEKSLSDGMVKIRKEHFESGDVKDLKTMKDLLFSSSSAAGDFVMGYSVSGPMVWKDKDGKSLKERDDNI